MIFTGGLRIIAAREAVYDRLCDARFFASCVEGVQALNEIDPTHYTAVLETRIAYIRIKFEVAVELVKLERPGEVVARAEGKPIGMIGRLVATSSATLAQEGEETVVSYTIDVALAGKLGAMGQPVLKSKAREMERQFVANLAGAFPNIVLEQPA